MTTERSTRALNLLQTVAIVAGVVYGGMELAQFRAEQQRQSRIELARSFVTPEYVTAFAVIESLPDSLTSERLYSEYAEVLPHFYVIGTTYENVGILVHRGDLDLTTVDDFNGSSIRTLWRKYATFAEERRIAEDSENVLEWFQWLAERIEEHRSTRGTTPAYVQFRDWTPPGR